LISIHLIDSNALINKTWPFLPHDAMLAQYMLSSCVCPSIGLSVTSRHCTKTAKRRITQITPESSFLTPKILAKF